MFQRFTYCSCSLITRYYNRILTYQQPRPTEIDAMCIVFVNVYADFLELNYCFGLAGWNVHSPKLRGFYVPFASPGNAGAPTRKTGLCPATEYL